uniref:Transmembrane protein n=1 Tax=Branchiostoma floridae TaxID=7739 RepID=C3ZJD0_BRAFL|eukprot:XP_002591261.1 hypothetical protein BRAFLDRAFT_76698 [Branchiostoma floridae]
MSSLGVVRDLGDQQVYYVDGKTFARRVKGGTGQVARQDGRTPGMNGTVGGEQARDVRPPYATYTPSESNRDTTDDLGQVNLVFVEGKTEGNVAKQEESTDWEPGKEVPSEGQRENSSTARKRRSKRRDRNTRCAALVNTTKLQKFLIALAVIGAALFIAGVVESIAKSTSQVGVILLGVSSAFFLPPCLYLAYISCDCCDKYCRRHS